MRPNDVTEDLRETLAAEDEAAALGALAGAARAGAVGAFDLLARRLSGRLMAYAYRTLENRPLAEEAVQETLVRVYRFLPAYRDGNFLGWCFTILHRVCADVARRERRHVSRPLESVEVVDADDPIAAVDLRAAVEHAVSRLPGHLRATFLLHQQGLAYDDVASVLSIPTGTVRSRLFEARKVLRVMLGDVLRKEKDR